MRSVTSVAPKFRENRLFAIRRMAEAEERKIVSRSRSHNSSGRVSGSKNGHGDRETFYEKVLRVPSERSRCLSLLLRFIFLRFIFLRIFLFPRASAPHVLVNCCSGIICSLWPVPPAHPCRILFSRAK